MAQTLGELRAALAPTLAEHEEKFISAARAYAALRRQQEEETLQWNTQLARARQQDAATSTITSDLPYPIPQVQQSPMVTTPRGPCQCAKCAAHRRQELVRSHQAYKEKLITEAMQRMAKAARGEPVRTAIATLHNQFRSRAMPGRWWSED